MFRRGFLKRDAANIHVVEKVAAVEVGRCVQILHKSRNTKFRTLLNTQVLVPAKTMPTSSLKRPTLAIFESLPILFKIFGCLWPRFQDILQWNEFGPLISDTVRKKNKLPAWEGAESRNVRPTDNGVEKLVLEGPLLSQRFRLERDDGWFPRRNSK